MYPLSHTFIVEEVLNEKWTKYKQPLRLPCQDLSIAIRIFTNMILELVDERSEAEKKHTISKNPEIITSTIDKIKACVEQHSYAFRKVCQTNFPFSHFDNSSFEAALKKAVKNYEPLLSLLMMEGDDWKDESELDKLYGGCFAHFEPNVISEACTFLMREYVNKSNNRAGYYLLWLLKIGAGCIYTIPLKSSFNTLTVKEVLSPLDYSFTNAVSFAEILILRSTMNVVSLSEAVFRTKKLFPICKFCRLSNTNHSLR